MVTSLGHDAVTSCAAARAGMARTRELEYFTVWSPSDGEVSPVTAHEIPEITTGFEANARLLRILQAALADLKNQHVVPWHATRWYLSLADPSREWRGEALIADEEIRNIISESGKMIGDDDADLQGAGELLEKALMICSIEAPASLKMVSRSGHCGVVECHAAAVQDLQTGQTECAIVGGCDSLLGEQTLEWLEFTGRLKSPSIPAGLAPGEAGVFLMLETANAAQQRSMPPLASVRQVHLGHEEKTLLSSEPPLGVGVAELLKLACKERAENAVGPLWLVTDQNGEYYRAMEWGQAVVRAVSDVQRLQDAVISYPAISFGDTGAASGGVAIATVLRAFNRGYSASDHATILSVSDAEPRGAVQLSKVA